ncbi:MAG: hypothetical protein Q8S20_06020 [Sulfuritalea sp.]|nr:hypothetical protein [Sulfuritalea sp.]
MKLLPLGGAAGTVDVGLRGKKGTFYSHLPLPEKLGSHDNHCDELTKCFKHHSRLHLPLPRDTLNRSG